MWSHFLFISQLNRYKDMASDWVTSLGFFRAKKAKGLESNSYIKLENLAKRNRYLHEKTILLFSVIC